MEYVSLLTDDDGQVYLQRNGEGPRWCLGKVTPDIYGMFPDDVGAWLDGEWEPAMSGATQAPDGLELHLVADYEPGTWWSHSTSDDYPEAWLYASGPEQVD